MSLIVYIKLLFPDKYLYSHKDCMKELNNNFLFNLKDSEEILRTLSKRNEYRACLVSEANNIYNHVFEFLGKRKKIAKRINWLKDIKSDFSWPLYLNKDCPIYYKNDSDIIYVWELSRFQHLFILSKAFLLTKDQKYFNEICSQISNWINQNPYKMGPNWITAMDVSIRSINWILVISMLCPYFLKNKYLLTKILVSLYLHGKFLENNLPLRKIKNGRWIGTNHYMTSLAGLLYLGVFFKNTPFGLKWLHMGKGMLFDEINNQFHPEGDNFEKTTCYHRLVGEVVSSCIILLTINKYNIPDYILKKLAKIYQFVVNYTRPDGEAPQIGDTDDGRLYRLGSYFNCNISNHNHLIELGNLILNNHNEHISKDNDQIEEENIWLTYKIIKNNQLPVNSSNNFKLTPQEHVCYPSSGFYIFRDQCSYTLVLSGYVGTRSIGNHSHNDLMSFELCYKGVPIIIDPGCYTYTGNLEERLLYRSTYMHNTIQIDDQEVNGIEKDKVFLMDEWAFPVVKAFDKYEDYIIWQAEHFGFCKGIHKVIHKRKILYFYNLSTPFWFIHDSLIPIDSFDKSKLPDLYKNSVYTNQFDFYVANLIFHLNKTDIIKKISNYQNIDNLSHMISLCTDIQDSANLSYFSGYEIEIDNKFFRILSFSGEKKFNSYLLDYKYAPSYGLQINSKKIVFKQKGNGILNFYTYLSPIPA